MMIGPEVNRAFRSLARTPWYGFATVVVMALGMALTASVLAAVDGLLFKPLPFREPDRLFAVSAGFSKLPDENRPMRWRVSQSELDAWREALPDVRFTAFENSLFETPTLETASIPRVDAEFFDTLGVPLLGNGFAGGDFVGRGTVRPAAISHGFWQRRFGGDRTALGRAVEVDDVDLTVRVVAVLPADFVFPHGPYVTDLVIPLTTADTDSHRRSLNVLARIAAGMNRDQVADRLTAATVRVAATAPSPREMPGVPERTRILRGPFDVVRLHPLQEALAWRSIQTARNAAWTAVGLLLLASLNVAGLTAARLQDRRHDLIVRRALGARDRDLVRTLVTENLVIVATGGMLGTLVARALLGTLSTLMPSALRFLKTPAIDARVLCMSAVAMIASTLVITCLSARIIGRSSRLAAPAPEGVTAHGCPLTRRPLVTGQVGLAVVMAISGALVAGSLLRVWGEDPGFSVRRTLVLTVSSTGESGLTPETVVRPLRELPGVRAAGGLDHPLLGRESTGNSFDRPPGSLVSELRGPSDSIEGIGVTAGYFEASGMRPIAGRLPTEREFESGAPVVVVSDRVARLYWPGGNPVGQSLTNRGRAFTVVGVVPDARYFALDTAPQPAIYWPLLASPAPILAHVLVSLDPSSPMTPRETAAAFVRTCPGCRVYAATWLSEALAASIRPRQFSAWLFLSFGVSALVIAGTGILGVVAMDTSRRKREIGIRLALGSTRGRVVRRVIVEQAGAVCAGLALGGLVAGWTVKYLAAHLYKTRPYDAWAWAATVALVLAVALVGAVLPARRASRLDPMQTLRVE